MAIRMQDAGQQLPEYVRGYILTPRETVTCELKPWINPAAREADKYIIAKTCLALRNSGGGVLLVGVADDGSSLKEPDEEYDPGAIFTQDTVQALVSAFAAEPFGIEVHQIHLEEPIGHRMVAIVVPGDIRTP